MDINSVLRKENLVQEESDTELILLSPKNNQIFQLNDTSKFLYMNCNGKSVQSVIKELYDILTDKESLSEETVFSDCINALEIMIANGLITVIS